MIVYTRQKCHFKGERMNPITDDKEIRSEIHELMMNAIKSSGMSAWESIDYEASLEAEMAEKYRLTKKEAKELNKKTPFIYVEGSLKKEAPKYKNIIEATRGQFKTDSGLSIGIPEDWEKRIFNDTSEFDHQYKLKFAKDYKAKYPALKKKIDEFEKFANENPDYVI